MSASNGVFGDPCVGTYKYLEVSYDCKYSKQIITVGEGDGTNYHFQGDLDVAIFPKRICGKKSVYIQIAEEVIVCHRLKPKGDYLLYIPHQL